jgi:hypothetical protein
MDSSFLALESFGQSLYMIDLFRYNGYGNSCNGYCLKYTKKGSKVIRYNGYGFRCNG